MTSAPSATPVATMFFVGVPLSVLVGRDPSGWSPIEEGDEEFWSLFGTDEATAGFGLCSDVGAPDWSQLLHRNPGDIAEIASALTGMGMGPVEVSVATDHEGRHLADLETLRGAMAASR